MAKLQVKLLATIYDQPQPGKDGEVTRDTPTVRRTEGEIFECIDQAEYDRLTAPGEPSFSGRRRPPAAVDPEKEHELRKAQLDSELERLKAEREALDARIEQTKSGADPRDASELKGKGLQDALERFGLDDSGSADEKRARVQEYLDANPDATLT